MAQSSKCISDYNCSALCLLGIKAGGIWDPDCPNSSIHVLGSLASTDILASHVVQTLQFHADTHVEPIHVSETKSTAVYRMTLPLTGFTFIVKTAWGDAIPGQQRECLVYDRMQHLQGLNIPVCLGGFAIPFNVVFGAHQTHYLILSSAGIPVTDGIVDEENKHRARAIYYHCAMDILKSTNVLHTGVNWRNVFYNYTINDFMLIDFANAEVHGQ